MRVKKVLFLVLGLVGLGLGFVGAVLPLIPAFPFLMLAAYSFARCSERLDRWFRGTRLYRDNLEDFVSGRGMTRAARRRVMGAITLVMAVGFALMALKGLVVPCAILLAVWLGHMLYFTFGVRRREEGEREEAATA